MRQVEVRQGAHHLGLRLDALRQALHLGQHLLRAAGAGRGVREGEGGAARRGRGSGRARASTVLIFFLVIAASSMSAAFFLDMAPRCLPYLKQKKFKKASSMRRARKQRASFAVSGSVNSQREHTS
jgi:hypothetical protein